MIQPTFAPCPAAPDAEPAIQPSGAVAAFDALFRDSATRVLALAPMQDVTDLPFLRMIARRGGADLYFTEYFRVHASAQLERYTLRSITENPTGQPIIAQLIGNDPHALARAARELQRYPVAAIDLNLGCPAPIVYRKCAGGGLLRQPALIDSILGALRDAVSIRFTIKTRIGFDDPRTLEQLLPLFAKHSPDLVTVHGRTVTEMYRAQVHLEPIATAVRALRCPVLANGGVDSPEGARRMLEQTGARGVMIGRGAIRNPWIFAQIRARGRGEEPVLPTGRTVLGYVRDLWEQTSPQGLNPPKQVQKLKKYLNFLGEGMEDAAGFLHAMRRVMTEDELFRVCGAWLDHDRPMALVPRQEGAMEAPGAERVCLSAN
ncbi:MAG: tRNA-dihydrouridine synthase family protein [Verrucomicrobiales bacterium]|nr:tRNA-dihydrouridine synthase family protein [Verrucomicrobiales bacterium]